MKDKTIMVIAAHPDDPEFAFGGTVSKWIKEGAKAIYVICTKGNRGSSDTKISPAKLTSIRQQEQQAAAKIIGADQVIFLDYNDGELVADLSLKEKLVRLIRKFKPDIVFSHDPSYFYFKKRGFINHTDHRACGEAVLDAAYPLARDLLSFPHHSEEGLTPHKVTEIYLANFEDPDFFVDVSQTVKTKIQAIMAHKSQVAHRQDLDKNIRRWLAENGKVHGYKFAESFRHLKLTP